MLGMMTDALTPPPSHRRASSGRLLGVGLGLLLLASYLGAMALAPMPAVSATPVELAVTVPTRPAIAWPSQGQAAVGVVGSEAIAEHSEQKPVPIASIAKLFVALAILERQPIEPGQPGGTITFTDADEQLYRDKVAQNQSVVPIATGEQLTQYQAFQAMLIPSGNNIAESMAIRVFGSVSGYVATVNDRLSEWGLRNTHIDDASGFSPKTVSTATDLVVLGKRVLANPILAEIVNQSTVTLPVAGELHNINALLGQNGIVGIKTGTTDEAGGCLLFAVDPGNDRPLLIGAILSQADRPAVFAATTAFIQASSGNFEPMTVAEASTTVASYSVPWDQPVSVVTKERATLVNPEGAEVLTGVTTPVIRAPTAQGTTVGSLVATVGGDAGSETPVVLDRAISRPPLLWKLTHPRAAFGAISQRLKRS